MNYRHTIYRYSTGQGPNMAVNIPAYALDFASFKMNPLVTNQASSESMINLKREADRVSMQVESAVQMLKTLGSNPAAADKIKILKARMDLINTLMLKYSLQNIYSADLNHLYSIPPEQVDGDLKKIFSKDNTKIPSPSAYDKFGMMINKPKMSKTISLGLGQTGATPVTKPKTAFEDVVLGRPAVTVFLGALSGVALVKGTGPRGSIEKFFKKPTLEAKDIVGGIIGGVVGYLASKDYNAPATSWMG